MGNVSPWKGRLESLSADRMLVTPDAELQGIKDKALATRIAQFSRRQIEYLCLSAASGKVRDLAHRMVGKDLNMRAIAFVRTHIHEARERYAACSAQEIRDAMGRVNDRSPECDLLRTIFREKAWKELSSLPLDALQSIQENNGSAWPGDILANIIGSRVGPPGPGEGDWWREQA